MRVLLADDQPKIRLALRVLLERQPDLEIVGEVAHADELLRQANVQSPDLVLLDWPLPGIEKPGTLAAFRRLRPGVFIIALGGRPEFRRAALRAGADAYVSKGDPPEQLLAAITCVHQFAPSPSHLCEREGARN